MRFLALSLSWALLSLGIAAAVLLFLLQSYVWAGIAFAVGLVGAYLHYWKAGG